MKPQKVKITYFEGNIEIVSFEEWQKRSQNGDWLAEHVESAEVQVEE